MANLTEQPADAAPAAPKRVGIIGTVGPIATIFLGHWTVNEPFTALQLAGAVLVLAGVSIVSARPDRFRAARPDGFG